MTIRDQEPTEGPSVHMTTYNSSRNIMVLGCCGSVVVKMRELRNPDHSEEQNDPSTGWSFNVGLATWNDKQLLFGA